MAMGKGKFFRDETGVLFSGIELICEFLRTMLNHNQFLLSIVSYSFYLFVEFAEVLILKGKSDAYK